VLALLRSMEVCGNAGRHKKEGMCVDVYTSVSCNGEIWELVGSCFRYLLSWWQDHACTIMLLEGGIADCARCARSNLCK
jgi:hypothetical protein